MKINDLSQTSKDREHKRQWKLRNPEAVKRYVALWRKRHPEKYLAQKKRYREKNKNLVFIQQKNWALRNPKKIKIITERFKKKNENNLSYKLKRRNQYLKRKYGINHIQYLDILKAQKGGCALCNRKQKIGRHFLHIDHCHSTGKVRGLLCSGCNVLLGLAKDDISLIKKAIQYLKLYSDKPVKLAKLQEYK